MSKFSFKENIDSITINRHAKVLVKDTKNTNLFKIGAVSNRNFNLILLPTERCNFRCIYCYEDYSVGKMKQETILGIKGLLDRRCADLDRLNVSWFGGEPLVAKSIVFEISEYATKLTHKYAGLVYTGDMTTNGYLLNYDTAKALADVGVRNYQISLDGPRDVHNQGH
jgi:uncharacterized protein